MSIAMLRAEISSRGKEIESVRQRSFDMAQKAITGALGYPDPVLIEPNEPEPGAVPRRGSVVAWGGGQPLNLRTDNLTQQTALVSRQSLGTVSSLEASADRFRVEVHKKYAIAFACIVFVLLGAPLAIRFPRGGVGMVIVVSVAIFAVYWAGLIGGENLANKGLVTPFWAMWTADLVFFALALALAARMSRTAGSNRGGALGNSPFSVSSWGRVFATRYRKA